MALTLRTKATLFLSLAAIATLLTVLATRGNHVSLTVTTTRAVRRDLKSWISSNGKAEPVEPQVIQSKLTTFIESVAVKEGQAVQAGQTLMTLDARDFETQLSHVKEQLVASEDQRKVAGAAGAPDTLAELQSNIAKSTAEIARLRRDGEALGRLYLKQAATAQEVEQNKLELSKAESDKRLFEQKLNEMRQRSDVDGQRAQLRVEEAQALIRSLESKLRSAVVKAATRGTLYSLPARPGMFVREGDVLAELADLTRIRVRIFVDEPDLGSLKQDQPVEITWDGLPNHVWNGRVEQLPKTIVARGSRNVGEVLCSVDNSDEQLLPNTNINARIRTAERDNSLAIARSAVRTEGNRHYVFVVDHDHLRKQEVQIGISNATEFEMVSGISENDVIALPGGSDLHDGLAITVS